MIDLPVLRSVLNGRDSDYCVWEPRYPMVVLGRGGIEEAEIFKENCIQDKVPVFRRKTGGGTVVLMPGVLVFSLAKKVSKELIIREYAQQVNDLVIEFLEDSGFKNLSVRGISDICIGDRKIMGSGMYRRKKILFFQASILVDCNINLMKRYLKPPPKQPEYRENRTHDSFVTTLKEKGWKGSTLELARLMDEFLKKNIQRIY